MLPQTNELSVEWNFLFLLFISILKIVCQVMILAEIEKKKILQFIISLDSKEIKPVNIKGN